MILQSDGFEFDFTDAIDAFVFDEKDPSKPRFHGFPMKGVDIVAEFQNDYVFVEMKHFDDPDILNQALGTDLEDTQKRQAHFKWLKGYLKYKYRDTYLFRHAENKVDKPIRYICLLNLDNALSSAMQKFLMQELPIKKHRLWQHKIIQSCVVVNLTKWNDKFTAWPARRLP